MEEGTRDDYRPFTFRALTWSLILAVFILLAQGVMGRVHGYSWTGEAAAAMMAVTYAVFSVFGTRLRPEEFATVYGMVETASCVFIPIGGLLVFLPDWAYARLSEAWTTYGDWMPSFLVPSDTAALRGLLEGGVLHMRSWIVPIIFIVAFSFCVYALGMFTILPFRKLYIEIERLPFPVATVGASVVEYTTKRQTNRLKWLWFGLLFGFILAIFLQGMLVQSMFPQFPAIRIFHDLSSYIQGPFPGGALALDGLTPDLIAWAYIIPLEVQISTWITSFVAYILLASVQVRMGVIPYLPGETFGTYSAMSAFTGVGFFHLAAGIYLAVGLVPLLLNYRYVIKTIRSFISGPTPGETEELALPYRYAWGGFIIFYVLTWIFLAAMGAHPLVAFAMLLWSVILFHGYMRTVALGDWMLPMSYATMASMDFLFVRTGLIGAQSPANWWTGASTTMMGDLSQGSVFSGETFRFAYLIGMKPKDMLKTQFIGLITALVLAILALFGISKFLGANHPLVAFNFFGVTQGIPIYAFQGVTQQMGQFFQWSASRYFGGFLFGLLYGGLKVVFPWTPISLVGILFGLAMPNYALLYFFTSVGKYLTLRMGGTRGYENVGLPFMAGFATGGILAAVFTAVANIFAAFGWMIAGIRGELVIGAVLMAITILATLWATRRAWTAPEA